MKYVYYSPENKVTPVPETVNFGSHCVVVPRLEEAGIPERLAMLAVIEPKVSIGDWVERGTLLAEALLPVFDRLERPSKTTFWVNDSFIYLRYELHSPVAGLVLTMEPQLSAYHGDSGATDSGESLCYGENEVRPVLLIPDDEPPPDVWSYDYYEALPRSLRVNFRQLLHSHKRGYMRLREVLGEFEDGSRAAISEFLTNSISTFNNKVKVVKLLELKRAERFVGSMRSRNPTLRRKLRHIGGMASDEL